MLEKLLSLLGINKTPTVNQNSTPEEIEKVFQQRSAHRVEELNEALADEDTPVGHIASLILNIEMIRYRVLHEANPQETEARRNELAKEIVQKIRKAPRTTLEPAGTYEPDVTYVNIMGNMGDGLIILKKERDKVMVPLLEELVREFGRSGDGLAAAILNGTYDEDLWEEYADKAQDSPDF
ncbi:hypothetical protein CMUST_03450 [Corynebacterium mustelae]|uniref:Uncharacterized protein n=1 Tax=Corynebacterium mustelae TaxID=571915 RepID=A0A0G3GV45_9CORY|nr:hypothetical protein [Corynebacterium mustelae]AKK05034.1 hypothetical protein CMUST_03450 [Corynebacterium mustelae]